MFLFLDLGHLLFQVVWGGGGVLMSFELIATPTHPPNPPRPPPEKWLPCLMNGVHVWCWLHESSCCETRVRLREATENSGILL